MSEISQEAAAEMLALLLDSQTSTKGVWAQRRDELVKRLRADGAHGLPVVKLHRQNAELRDIMADLVIAARKLRHSAECNTERARNLEYIAGSLRKAEQATRWSVP